MKIKPNEMVMCEYTGARERMESRDVFLCAFEKLGNCAETKRMEAIEESAFVNETANRDVCVCAFFFFHTNLRVLSAEEPGWRIILILFLRQSNFLDAKKYESNPIGKGLKGKTVSRKA